MNTKLILASLSLMLSFGSTLAQGAGGTQSTNGGPQITVSYADLNLTNATGAKRLYQRIETAAAQVCGPENGNLGTHLRRKSCISRAVREAVAEVAAPELTRYYVARTGKSAPSTTLAARP